VLRLGVIGYSAQEFDVDKAREILKKEFEYFKKIYGDDVVIVSGLTAMGVPLLAYEEAKKNGWKTVGIACKKAYDYERFPVDEEIIVGEEWGDESETFLKSIDMLLKIGGGRQSLKEVQMAKEMGLQVAEYSI